MKERFVWACSRQLSVFSNNAPEIFRPLNMTSAPFSYTMFLQPPRSLQSNSKVHGLKSSKSLQRSKAVSEGHSGWKPSWDPPKEAMAQSSYFGRVSAERLHITFPSFVALGKYPTETNVLDPVLYALRRRSGYRLSRMQSIKRHLALLKRRQWLRTLRSEFSPWSVVLN